MKKQLVVLLVLVFFGIGLLAIAGTAQAAPAKVKLGVQPWLGYGPWWIAEKNGYFEKRGIDVQVINFTWDQDMGAALAAGQLDVVAGATNFVISMRNQGIDLQGFLLLDASFEADAILAPAEIKSIKDLKGKSVAYEYGATSDLLLNYALRENGMSRDDIKPVPMAAADAGLALISGRVDIAVTYEPYISAALREGKGYKSLYTAAERPGLISDLAVAETNYIKNNPDVIKALTLAWDDAVTFLNAHPEEGGKIIADAVGSPMDEFKVAFEGVRVYDLKGNYEAFQGDFLKTFTEVGQIMAQLNPKEIKTIPTPQEALAIGQIKELAGK
jgi:NitT/TauT family transport system substrate-binding protein